MHYKDLDIRDMWIGSKNGVSIYAFSSQYQVDMAIRLGRIDSGYPVEQFQGSQLAFMIEKWQRLPWGSK